MSRCNLNRESDRRKAPAAVMVSRSNPPASIATGDALPREPSDAYRLQAQA
jgi:hypothetical protein